MHYDVIWSTVAKCKIPYNNFLHEPCFKLIFRVKSIDDVIGIVWQWGCEKDNIIPS